jgi:hypothetical protein
MAVTSVNLHFSFYIFISYAAKWPYYLTLQYGKEDKKVTQRTEGSFSRFTSWVGHYSGLGTQPLRKFGEWPEAPCPLPG